MLLQQLRKDVDDVHEKFERSLVGSERFADLTEKMKLLQQKVEEKRRVTELCCERSTKLSNTTNGLWID